MQLLPRVGFEPTTCWSQVQHFAVLVVPLRHHSRWVYADNACLGGWYSNMMTSCLNVVSTGMLSLFCRLTNYCVSHCARLSRMQCVRCRVSLATRLHLSSYQTSSASSATVRWQLSLEMSLLCSAGPKDSSTTSPSLIGWCFLLHGLNLQKNLRKNLKFEGFSYTLPSIGPRADPGK